MLKILRRVAFWTMCPLLWALGILLVGEQWTSR